MPRLKNLRDLLVSTHQLLIIITMKTKIVTDQLTIHSNKHTGQPAWPTTRFRDIHGKIRGRLNRLTWPVKLQLHLPYPNNHHLSVTRAQIYSTTLFQMGQHVQHEQFINLPIPRNLPIITGPQTTKTKADTTQRRRLSTSHPSINHAT